MKNKILSLALLVCIISFPLFACEKSTELRCAFITEISAPSSNNKVVRVSYQEDKRLEDKGTDVQIKFNNIGTIKIGKENQEKFDYKIKDYDEWYSMTAIFAEKENKSGQEEYEKFQDALTKTYLFEYDGEMKITLRVVAGNIEDNVQSTGQILAETEPISDNFTIKI